MPMLTELIHQHRPSLIAQGIQQWFIRLRGAANMAVVTPGRYENQVEAHIRDLDLKIGNLNHDLEQKLVVLLDDRDAAVDRRERPARECR